jgi:hypothetical protein
MQAHFWEKPSGCETGVMGGFSELRPSAYKAAANAPIKDFRVPPEDQSKIAKYLFGGFEHGLFSEEEFQSNPERRLA